LLAHSLVTSRARAPMTELRGWAFDITLGVPLSIIYSSRVPAGTYVGMAYAPFAMILALVHHAHSACFSDATCAYACGASGSTCVLDPAAADCAGQVDGQVAVYVCSNSSANSYSPSGVLGECPRRPPCLSLRALRSSRTAISHLSVHPLLRKRAELQRSFAAFDDRR
jgi:hypothetical protein